ncbi:MAG: oligosaccharide flippase family protein [Bacteroidales bacterium]|nr:oligosaccharide flippase family protein [Bacteroidales bacterium]
MGIVQKDSIKITVLSYIGAAIGYLNKILLFTNFLTTEQVGLANIIVPMATIIAQLASLGTNGTTLRFFPFFKTKDRKHNGYLFWAITVITFGFIIFASLFLIFKHPILNYYQKNSPLITEYYFYLIPLALAILFFNFFDNYLRSLFKNIVPVFVYEVLLRVFVSASIVLYAFNLVNFHHFFIIYLFANSLPAFVLLLYVIFLKQFYFKPIVSTVLRRLLKIIFVYSLFSFVNIISYQFLTIVDSLMVAGMINLKATGIYTTVLFITGVMLIPYKAIQKVSAPIISESWKKRDMKTMADVYKKTSAVNLVTGLFIFVLLWVNFDNILMLIPKEYESGKYVFLILGFAKMCDMYTGVNGTILFTSKNYRWDLLFTVVLIFLTIFLNKMLIPVYGIEGAAIASLLTIFTYNALRVLFVQLKFKMHPLHFKHILVLMICVFVSLISTKINYMGNLFIDVIVRSLICAIIFAVPVFYLKVSEDINSFIVDFLNKIKLKIKK